MRAWMAVHNVLAKLLNLDKVLPKGVDKAVNEHLFFLGGGGPPNIDSVVVSRHE